MKLLFDIGNSRIKWAWLGADGLQPMRAANYSPSRMAEWCREHLAEYPVPQTVRVANVGGEEVAAGLEQWCAEQWQLRPQFAETARAAGGVHNGYENVVEMGVDRWLGLVAARQRYPGALCVISCGTAVTLDAVNGKGDHLGGLILPGPQLMRALLNRGTHGARTARSPQLTLELGRSTASCVAAGSAYAIAGMLERAVEDISRNGDGPWHYLATGGGIEAILPLCRLELEVIPDLVLQGLALEA